ncbi:MULTISPECIES: TIGR03758 family integrating conjugative element protein [Halomonadaceae]|uniref:TIGR03758 family integrating conjugative element protein n=2 Tax=Oceanospirillales TaxID=135619 RepID=UPI000A02B414|nr:MULTISPECIES: TIGR03758 family integrating conjugative element protein [Halomonadaceae]MDF9434647.1 TIGR03758 family integrating conjugative element protein [Chromohalobacter israelensis]
MALSMQEAFKAGASATPDDLYLLIAGVGCALAVIWLAWLGVSNWRGWVGGMFSEHVMTWNFIRGVMVVVILFWLFL